MACYRVARRLQNRRKGEGTWWSKTKGLKAAVFFLHLHEVHAQGLTGHARGKGNPCQALQKVVLGWLRCLDGPDSGLKKWRK